MNTDAQLGLFSAEPRAHARRTDPETSKAAADSVRGIRESQQFILGLFRRFGPMTDERLVLRVSEDRGPHVKLSPSGIRTRRKELESLILVRFTGRREKISTGRLARVWEAI
jgi:hypothetical protein